MWYLVRRLINSVVLIFVVVTITFFLVHLLPGSPYTLMVNQLIKQGFNRVQAEQQASALFGYSVNQPIVHQYLSYLNQLVHGNLGTSLMYPGQSVRRLILHAVPWTILIVLVSLIVSFGVGILIGTVAAYRRGGWFDRVATILSSLLNGIPQYLSGLVLFYFLAILAGLFPIGGAYAPGVTPGLNAGFFVSAFYHALLPMSAFVISSFAGWSLSMKSNTVSVLGEDYIMAARAMAIDERHIITSYVARNAILPQFTTFVLSIGYMFGGALFVEQIFNYPGLGQLFLNGTNNRDFPLMEGCFLLLTVTVVLANVAADLLYSRIDPRIR